MKKETTKKLIEKYKSGTTSLEEEKALFDDTDIADESIRKLSIFVKNNKAKVPEDLNERLWMAFDQKVKEPYKFKTYLIAIAASVALILSIFIGYNNNDELTYEEKEAMLNEAKSMFSEDNEEKINYHKILENDLIIVYTKVE